MKVLHLGVAAALLVVHGAHSQQAGARFGNSLAAPAAAPGERTLQTVEATGRGPTEIAARKAAVDSAIEQVVGVYVDSRRSAEMNMTGGQVEQAVREQVLTFSSAFVERVETLSTQPEGQGYVVRIRAQVSVPVLLQAMRQANLPVAAVNRASVQSKFDSQSRESSDASTAAKAILDDVAAATQLTVVQDSIGAELDPNNNGVAVLHGQFDVSFDPAWTERALHLGEAFEPVTGKTGSAWYGGFTDDLVGWARNINRPPGVAICQADMTGGMECRGHPVDPQVAFSAFKGFRLTVELLSGQSVVSKLSAKIRLDCLPPGVQARPSYIEAPLGVAEETYSNAIWMSEYNMAHDGARAAPARSFWGSAEQLLRSHPAVLYSTRYDMLSQQPDRGRPPSTNATAPDSVCTSTGSDGLVRIVIPVGSGPVRRNFYVVAQKTVIEKVDGIRMTIQTDDGQHQ